VGFFKADRAEYGGTDVNEIGLFYGGNGQLLLAQCIGVLTAVVLSCSSTYLVMKLIQKTVGTDIRCERERGTLVPMTY
jgi:ammonia channel protein AmtB